MDDDLVRAQRFLQQAIDLYDTPVNRAANLDRAIELLGFAADIFARDPRTLGDWGVTQYELGLAFGTRINGDRRANLSAAIAHYLDASKAFTLETDPDRFAMVQQNLGAVFSGLADIDPLDLSHHEGAIEAGRAAMKAHAKRGNPIDWASAANNLAVACRNTFHGPRAERIEEAVDLHEAALGVFTAGAVDMEEALQLRRSDNRHWNDALVRLAPQTWISLQQGEEQYTRTAFIRDRARTLLDLANALGARLRGDQARNQEAAINAGLEALRLFGELRDVQQQARVANNLANDFQARIAGAPFDNAERAIHYYRHALAFHRRGSSAFEIAQTEQNLGVTLLNVAIRFFEQPRQERDAAIAEAIDLLRSSLLVRTKDRFPYHWAMTTSMLALAHLHRIEGEKEANVEEAIRLFVDALSVDALRIGAPHKWLEVSGNYADAFSQRRRGERRTNLEQAVRHYRVAVEGLGAAGLLDQSLPYRRGLADALTELDRKAEARELLRATIEEVAAARSLSEWTQSRREWSVRSTEFIDRLVALSWSESAGEALEWSEFGRARALAEIQISRRRRPAGVADRNYESYIELQTLQADLERTLTRIQDGDAARPSLLARIHDARMRCRALEVAFREADPSWSPVVVPLKLNELLETASLCRMPILVVRVNDEATYAWLLLPQQFLVAKRFETPTRGHIRRLLVGTEDDRQSSWIGSYLTAKDPDGGDFSVWLDTMNARLGDLWIDFVAGLHEFVAEALPDAEELILIPSQSLGVLPLHAAWRNVEGETRFWCDDYAIGYAPSIATLRIARSKAPTSSPATLLTVADPTARWPLPWARIEGARVTESFEGGRALLISEATRENVLAALARRPRMILFSCHGRWDSTEPWLRAGFVLADSLEPMPNLTLRDLAALDFTDCQLAILSACETGMSDINDPADEFMGLPAAFLAAGTSTVVGSLWTIDDVSTSLTITKAFSEIDLERPVDALARLHAAQKWIRNAGPQELVAALKKLNAPAERYEQAVAELESRGKHPCAHPFWWAALTCVGVP